MTREELELFTDIRDFIPCDFETQVLRMVRARVCILIPLVRCFLEKKKTPTTHTWPLTNRTQLYLSFKPDGQSSQNVGV